MKRCETCILNQFDKDEFKCKGDKNAPDCIGQLQGVIELLSSKNRYCINNIEANNGAVRVDYAINGVGSLYFPSMPTDEEIASGIIGDCNEMEIGIEVL